MIVYCRAYQVLKCVCVLTFIVMNAKSQVYDNYDCLTLNARLSCREKNKYLTNWFSYFQFSRSTDWWLNDVHNSISYYFSPLPPHLNSFNCQRDNECMCVCMCVCVCVSLSFIQATKRFLNHIGLYGPGCITM